MAQKRKLQVFVSSTYTDLKEERQAAVEAILTAGHIPAGMELFAAGDKSQMAVINKWIDESDVYLLLLGGRYGSIEPTTGKSYTHLEYEYALNGGKALFAVVIDEHHLKQKVKEKGIEVWESENPHKLKEFKAIVTSKLVKFWTDLRDIKLAIAQTLSEFEGRNELIGWTRHDEVTSSNLLKNTNFNIEFIQDFLTETSKNFVSNYDMTDEMYVDEFGNCTFVQWAMITPASEFVTHHNHTYVVDKPGIMRILEAVDIDTGKELKYVYSSNKGIYHKLTVLFNSAIKRGRRQKFKYSVSVENYMSNLIDKGIGERIFSPLNKAKFVNIETTLYFPDIKLFENLSVTLIKHPQKEAIDGDVIVCKLENNFKSFKIVLGDISKITSEIAIRVMLNNKL